MARVVELFAYVLVGCMAFSTCSPAPHPQEKELAYQNSTLIYRLHDLETKLDSVENTRTRHSEVRLISGYDPINAEDIAYLEEIGLRNPVPTIKADLLAHVPRIAAQEKLNGSTHLDESQVHVLNRKWVLACFEDTHHTREMILEYGVGKNGAISWKVLDTTSVK